MAEEKIDFKLGVNVKVIQATFDFRGNNVYPNGYVNIIAEVPFNGVKLNKETPPMALSIQAGLDGDVIADLINNLKDKFEIEMKRIQETHKEEKDVK